LPLSAHTATQVVGLQKVLPFTTCKLAALIRMHHYRLLGLAPPDGHLLGVSPVPVSSGKTNRHRLNRAANSALHIIAIGRLRTYTKTQEYVVKRVAEGHSKMEALRYLKRYISCEVYTLLRNQNRLFNSTQITT